MDPLLLNGGNPWDELLMVGGAILLAWIVIRLTTRGDKSKDDKDGGAEGSGDGGADGGSGNGGA